MTMLIIKPENLIQLHYRCFLSSYTAFLWCIQCISYLRLGVKCNIVSSTFPLYLPIPQNWDVYTVKAILVSHAHLCFLYPLQEDGMGEVWK